MTGYVGQQWFEPYKNNTTGSIAIMTTLAARIWLMGGRVQGVGFRPYVYRLACEHGLNGWVINHSGQVEIMAQGETTALDNFSLALINRAPAVSQPLIDSCRTVTPQALTQFSIRHDSIQTESAVHVAADISMCDACRLELTTPGNRRYHYPFINCSQCGPRYSIMARLPYDRSNTSMQTFPLCQQCRHEYDSADDRRFHAQTMACPHCGPELSYVAEDKKIISGNEAALAACIMALHQGAIVAIKGIGGYHLACDACNEDAVRRLRQRKSRPDKPLAVMLPLALASNDLHSVVNANPQQLRCLSDPLRPIVLVGKLSDSALSPSLAPGLNEVGIMLPYSPLHQLLLDHFSKPLVMTSANLSGEPVYINNNETEKKLAPIADAFLHHNRTILHPADDPVYRCIANRPRPLRLGRGNAPLELTLPRTLAQPLLAVGGHMKNTIALAWQNRIVISAHIGDLSHPRSLALFNQQIEDLQSLYQVSASTVICDSHPDYASSRWAMDNAKTIIKIQHHHAHAATLTGEYPDISRWLVFTWDGVGLGDDGALWGGEAFLGKAGSWDRQASFRPFHIPGSDQAAREPWRCAATLLWETNSEWNNCSHDSTLLREAWQRRINSPATTSVGRLFDAAAALLGLIDTSSYEAQAAMTLEACAHRHKEQCLESCSPLPGRKNSQGIYESDWAPLLPQLLNRNLSVSKRAVRFHQTLAYTLLDQALVLRKDHGDFCIGLSGGVFQNRYLTELVISLLRQHDFDVRMNEKLPCNDAGLSYGQIMETAAYQFDPATNIF